MIMTYDNANDIVNEIFEPCFEIVNQSRNINERKQCYYKCHRINLQRYIVIARERFYEKVLLLSSRTCYECNQF